MSIQTAIPPTPPPTAGSHPVNLSDYTIVPVNDTQQQLQYRAAFVPWNHGTSFDTFSRAAEKERARAEWAAEHGLITWALVRRDDLPGELYASCETFRRKALVKRQNTNELEDTWMYAIASVVTPVQYLRKGYATHLLRLLHYHLADTTIVPAFPSQWGAPPPLLPPALSSALPKAIASILWTDVGSNFYSRCTVGPDRPGWVVHDHMCQELVWKILPPSNEVNESPWELIYEGDLPKIAQMLSQAARDKLQVAAGSSRTLFQNDPISRGTLSFVPIRGSYFETPSTASEPCGARLKFSNGEEAIVLFTAHNVSIGQRLLITYIHNLRPADADSLLRVLDGIGSKAGRTEGWVWDLDPSSELAQAWRARPQRQVLAGRRAETNGHLLGVAWYGSDEEGRAAEVVDRQMWGWC